MIKYYSMRMKLDDVIGEGEQVVLENIRRCSNIVGRVFRVVFWNVNLTEQECKDFVKRNEHLLFEVNTKITKKFENVWFLINSINDETHCRYKYEGDILDGIAEYLKIINHMKRRDGET